MAAASDSFPRADRALAYSTQTEQKTPVLLPWPAYGQAAYGVADKQIIAVSSDQNKAVPIASLAKVITALAVLKAKPLAPGSQGPAITLTQADVDIFSSYVSKNGTVIPVEAGENISELQALQAMLMPSANNIADSLVIWAFGSVQAYSTYANNMLKELGIHHTTITDASGFSPSTVSTAQDMVAVGALYMKNPILQAIARQDEADVPLAGKIPNYNTLINKDGLMGIKVGDTDEAGRCFMLANIRTSGGTASTSVTVVLVPRILSMQPTLQRLSLVLGTRRTLSKTHPIKEGPESGPLFNRNCSTYIWLAPSSAPGVPAT